MGEANWVPYTIYTSRYGTRYGGTRAADVDLLADSKKARSAVDYFSYQTLEFTHQNLCALLFYPMDGPCAIRFSNS